MNQDVFLAILAMDSYNRGYNEGVKLPNGNGIGLATLRTQSDTREDSDARRAGFYASAYDMSAVAGYSPGQTVISYRGTDGASDVWSGWTAGLGFNAASQPQLAIEFYKAVARVGSLYDVPSSTITLTGHSLGGGLAGFISSLTGQNSLLFDHMPFGVAAFAQGTGFTDVQYGLPRAYHVAGEVLIPVRNGTALAVAGGAISLLFGHIGAAAGFATAGAMTGALDSLVANTRLDTFGTGLALDPVERHSMALLTVLLYADKQWKDEGGSGRATDWQSAAELVTVYKAT